MVKVKRGMYDGILDEHTLTYIMIIEGLMGVVFLVPFLKNAFKDKNANSKCIILYVVLLYNENALKA